MVPTRPRRLRLAAAVAFPVLLGSAAALAQSARVRVTLQPDCYRASLASACDPRKTGSRLDLGPQIAIWIETADGRLVDTVMVTNLTARLGIGNRPGYYLLPSSPKFPYGRRLMALPVWAHRRGKLYDSVVMQDGTDRELWLGFHESVSSPDPYFCRPMTFQEIDVDAVSCPTARFNSAKGRFFDPALDLAPSHQENGRPKDYVPPPRSYYPPRNDLTTFTELDCTGDHVPGCAINARSYAAINDLDAVAAATPPYGQPSTHLWSVPDALADGDYAVLVEVNKEFDESPSHRYLAAADPMLREWGLVNNFGQPSVVFRAPFRLNRRTVTQAATSDLAGYGDWDGKTGTLHPPDRTINDSPGSGVGRLLLISQPGIGGAAALLGRVHVLTELGPAPPAPAPDAGAGGPDGGGGPPGPSDGSTTAPDVAPVSCLPRGAALDLELSAVKVMSEAAEMELKEPARELWEKTESYEVRVWNGSEKSPSAFAEGTPLPRVAPVRPGNRLTVALGNLKSESQYTVGVRPTSRCADPPIVFATFTTVIREFKQLSGCFIATAAYGGPLAAKVELLRRARDRVRDGSALAAAAADLYGRSSPPLAEVLRGTEAGRAVVRAVLSPLVGLLETGVALSPEQR
jgi:hypothetical protein